MTAVKKFKIPNHLNAAEPAEVRGSSREDVRLLVLDRPTGKVITDHFQRLPHYLNPGDLVVLNNSRTIPAVLKGTMNLSQSEVRLSRQLSGRQWEAIVLGTTPPLGTVISFAGGLTAIVTAYGSQSPLLVLTFSKSNLLLLEHFYRIGQPVRYEYIHEPWPLDAYQTAFASIPGSVEMPSAGRALSWRMLNLLKEKGIRYAFLQLHAGLSFYENDIWPDPLKHAEAFCIPAETARLVNETRRAGGRIIAVGTTAVRALETAADTDGTVKPAEGFTNLYIKKGHVLKATDGLLTGLHEPEASHLDLLSAFLPEDHLMNAYTYALEQGFLWHEFGDMNLILNGGIK
ncbi:MAG TPA: S-adenosylmethionine:tRNA ribosyltransferase-isomerase [Bacillaceae bacterium]